jgi:hypothetical protein
MTVSKLLTSLALCCCAFLVVACAARRIHDYRFSITGVVTDEDGTPIQDAQVKLELSDPVYSGITPVKTEQIATNSWGGFVIMEISHQRGVKYTLTVFKSGFQPQTVSGSSPPAGHHTIRLKKSDKT